MGLDVADGSVRMIVNIPPPRAEAARATIGAVGGQIEAEFESSSGQPFALQVLIPVSAIEEIADRPQVLFLRTPARE